MSLIHQQRKIERIISKGEHLFQDSDKYSNKLLRICTGVNMWYRSQTEKCLFGFFFVTKTKFLFIWTMCHNFPNYRCRVLDLGCDLVQRDIFYTEWCLLYLQVSYLSSYAGAIPLHHSSGTVCTVQYLIYPLLILLGTRIWINILIFYFP